MPLYEFRCPQCGPFDLRRDMQDVADAAVCPSCDRPARRVYSFSSGGRPWSGPLRDATRADRARVDRARPEVGAQQRQRSLLRVDRRLGLPVATGPLRRRA